MSKDFTGEILCCSFLSLRCSLMVSEHFHQEENDNITSEGTTVPLKGEKKWESSRVIWPLESKTGNLTGSLTSGLILKSIQTHTYLPVILSRTTIKNLLHIMTLVSSKLFPSIQIIIDSLKLTMLTKRRSAKSCRKIPMKWTRTEVLGVKHALPLPFPLIPPLLLH